MIETIQVIVNCSIDFLLRLCYNYLMVAPGDKSPIPDISLERVSQTIDGFVPVLQENIAKIAAYENRIEPYLRLRDSFCGPVATAVSETLTAEGVPTSPMVADMMDISSQYPSVQRRHVIAVTEAADESIITDATYGQHFRPFGLTLWFAHDKLHGTDPYPEEQVLIFPKSRTAETAEAMASFVEDFWQAYADTDEFKEFWKHAPEQIITNVSHEQLVEYFMAIWDIDRYEPFEINSKSRLLVNRLRDTA